MIKMITRNLKTLEVINEKDITDNWWDVYWQAARMDGRKVTFHDNNSYSVTYNEKNKIYTFTKKG